jgi:hypothetical protein
MSPPTTATSTTLFTMFASGIAGVSIGDKVRGCGCHGVTAA